MLTTRMRRLRSHPGIRSLISETQLSKYDFIQPLFIHHGENIKNPIASMPGQYQWSLDRLPEILDRLTHVGITGVILFGIPKMKDSQGSDVLSDTGIIYQAVEFIKKQAPDLLVIADTCFCEYTDHGHCGVIKNKRIDNDATLELLGQQAVIQARAGADIIAPSGMMDGMVSAIRQALDLADFSHIPILSYAVKYASAFYGPFRDAAQGAPQFGDRKSYQMDSANTSEALREAQLDIAEGADMLMVKPALSYLDIISKIKNRFPEVPLCAYNVSGEYAMIKAASSNGWLDEEAVMVESLLSIKRAGADFMISYFSEDMARLLA